MTEAPIYKQLLKREEPTWFILKSGEHILGKLTQSYNNGRTLEVTYEIENSKDKIRYIDSTEVAAIEVKGEPLDLDKEPTEEVKG